MVEFLSVDIITSGCSVGIRGSWVGEGYMIKVLWVLPTMLFLAGCNSADQISDTVSPTPETILSSLSNSNSKTLNDLMVSEFHVSRFDNTTIYTIEEGYGPDACGSSGCNWTVYVKTGEGPSKKVSENLAYDVNVFRTSEDRFRLVMTSSGLSCENKTNIEQCDRVFEWDGSQLIETRR